MSPIRGLTVPRYALGEKAKLVESLVNQGLITSADPADIPNGALTYALNARVRYDKTQRRSGRTLLTPAAPDANKVLEFALFKANDGTTRVYRFTRNSINLRGDSSWTAYTAGTGGSLTGTDDDRFQVVVVFNKMFSANGVDKIQFLDTVAAQFKEAGTNAPKVRYLTGFYNRLVGAYRVEVTEANGPVSLVWCADGDTTKWPNDASPDPSSGQSPLVESPSDLADFITGVFGFTNVLVVPREKSIWLANKQPSASNPFFAYAAVPGVGSDCPYSIAMFPGGIAFVDTLSSTVWAYSIGGSVERIGEPIESDLTKAISDPKKIFGSFNFTDAEYSIGVPLVGTNTVRVWTRNFRTKSWVTDEVENLSLISDIDSPFVNVLSFDELAGTFDGLTGTFDQLVSTLPPGRPARYYGFTNGVIHEESASASSDAGSSFTFDIQSKEFVAPDVDVYFAEIRVDYLADQSGNLTLYYSKDSGQTWKTARTITTAQNKRSIIRHARHVKSRTLRWRLTATSGQIKILGYEIHIYPSGSTRK